MTTKGIEHLKLDTSTNEYEYEYNDKKDNLNIVEVATEKSTRYCIQQANECPINLVISLSLLTDVCTSRCKYI